MGIGESQVAEILGEELLRGAEPGGRHLRAGRGGRRAASGGRPVADGSAADGGRRRGGRGDRHGAARPSTSGPRARRPGPTRSAHDSRRAAGGWPRGARHAAGRSGRCSATSSGSRSPSPAPTTTAAPPRRDETGVDRLAAASAIRRDARGPRSGWRSGTARRGGDTAVTRGGRDPDGEHRERPARVPGRAQGGPRRADRGRGAVRTCATARGCGIRRHRRRARASGQRRAVAISPSRSVTTMRVALQPDQPVVGELAEELVHALARAADHRREVGLGQVRAQAEAPSAAGVPPSWRAGRAAPRGAR